MERCDALIVGGGPAGSTCAWKLRRAGMDVVVLDKKAFPRDKVCAGWITPAVVDELQIDVDEYRSGLVFQPITGFHTGSLGGDTVHTRYGHPVSYGIRRCEFDHYLLRRSGARLRLGEALTTLRRDGDGWTANDSIRAAMIVGAGGHFCPVARFLGARLGASEQAIAAQEVEFELTAGQAQECRVAADTPELYFCPDLKGYGWCFRKGDFLNIGLGREDNHRLSDQTAAFCAFLQQHQRIPKDIPTRFNGHAYLLYSHASRRLVDDGVILIGDAAGLAHPQSGEGIRPAIESGLLAADAVIAAAGDYSKARLEPYRERLCARFGPRGTGNGWSDRLPAAASRAIGRMLLGSSWFARHVVLDRWFLNVAQPRLADARSRDPRFAPSH